MKRIFTTFCLVATLMCDAVAQNCVTLGCSAAYTVTANSTQPGVTFPANSTCFANQAYIQGFWQFFFSATGGDYTQTFTPGGADGATVSVDWTIFDVGTVAPADFECPVDVSTWTELVCGATSNPGAVKGPGTDGTATTVAGHFYAVGIILDEFGKNYTIDIGAPTLNGSPLGAGSCSGIVVLPVRLASFDAIATNCTVNLNWSSVANTNLKQYEVQYSSGGNNFTTLATVAAKNGATAENYAFSHTGPQQGKGMYRLKMTDQAGKVEYSRIIAMKFDCGRNTVFGYPNPVADVFNVNIVTTRNELTAAKLFNSNGKLVFTGNLINGTNKIGMTGFAKGLYMLELKNSSGTQTLKIVK